MAAHVDGIFGECRDMCKNELEPQDLQQNIELNNFLRKKNIIIESTGEGKITGIGIKLIFLMVIIIILKGFFLF